MADIPQCQQDFKEYSVRNSKELAPCAFMFLVLLC